jgi:branched-chain amino acid transport system substrate-binding protein
MKNRKWLASLALVAVVLMVAAGCSNDKTPSGGTAATPPKAGSLGAVTVAAGAPIKFAVIEATTGDGASLGTDQVRGAEIAVDDRDGTLLDHKIELVKVDEAGGQSCGTAGPGGEAAQKVAAQKDQIVGIIGTSCSGAAVPAMGILSPLGFTMISGSNTSPFLTSVGGNEGENHKPGYFRVAHNDEFQGKAAADCVFTTLGATKAATINDGDPYTVGLAQAFAKSFTEAGGEIVDETAVAKTDTDMHAVLTEIASKGAEIIFFPIFQPAADFIAKQAKDVAGLENTALMAADGVLSDTFVGSKSGAFVIPEVHDTPTGPKGTARGMYFSGPLPPTSGAYTDFLAKYKEKYGEDPIQAYHAHGYDAFNVLAAAVEKSAVKLSDGSLFIDRQKLRDAVQSTTNLTGLTGSITCNQFGDCASVRIAVFQATADTPDLVDVKANIICQPAGG